MNILYMGTPQFAIAPLQALLEAGHTVKAVICQPDKPKGRGHKMLPPPVKVFASEHGLPVFQPKTLRDEEFFGHLQDLNPEIIVVAAYGKLLPKNVLEYPKYGCINIHASLLPKYRGAAPIQRAIMDGESQSGVTVMRMEEGLDTGDMLLKKSVPIDTSDNADSLTLKLSHIGAELIAEALLQAANGSLSGTPQDESLASYAAKIEKEDCRMCFDRDAVTLANQVRALASQPLAYAMLCHDGLRSKLKIAKAEAIEYCGKEPVGTVVDTSGALTVRCKDGALRITELIPEGKNKMSAADFCRGRKAAIGDLLE